MNESPPDISSPPEELPHHSLPSPGETARVKPVGRLVSGALYLVHRRGSLYVVSENYSYKTEPYYFILSRELSGTQIFPGSSSVLDAYIVPVCLDRASRAGIPVAECTISQSCGKVPAILYGLNYFSCASEYAVVQSMDAARDVIRHITNSGKYPFCYQPLDDDDDVVQTHAIFGRIQGFGEEELARSAELLFSEFHIPLVTMVWIHRDGHYLLSSLTPTRYSTLSPVEKSLLRGCLSGQEFL
ncbi:MAG: hypothetical protein GKC07_08270 [Methanomicrobiales archaeon]|nr:hypothetical protein [Methanomicrobiales archaeon]